MPDLEPIRLRGGRHLAVQSAVAKSADATDPARFKAHRRWRHGPRRSACKPPVHPVTHDAAGQIFVALARTQAGNGDITRAKRIGLTWRGTNLILYHQRPTTAAYSLLLGTRPAQLRHGDLSGALRAYFRAIMPITPFPHRRTQAYRPANGAAHYSAFDQT